MITNYKHRKLIQYLQPGQKVLIRFGHGLGDAIMFMPVLEELRRRRPDTQIDLYVECGQEKIWNSVPNKEAEGYDWIFSLDFPMSEGSGLTKREKCARDELGLHPDALVDIPEFAPLPECPSPIVCVHFQGTALPGPVNCPEDTAALIWREIHEAGLIPFECHYRHCFHNPINGRMWFVDSTAREAKASLRSLFGLLQHSRAFIGVASGPFCAAMSIMPDRTMFLEKRHKARDYTRRVIPIVDLNLPYVAGTVRRWLDGLK